MPRNHNHDPMISSKAMTANALHHHHLRGLYRHHHQRPAARPGGEVATGAIIRAGDAVDGLGLTCDGLQPTL